MDKVIIYHNNRCSTSRCTLDMLHREGVEPEVVDYLDGHLTEEDLKKVLKLLKIPAEMLVRKKEPIYKEKYAAKKLNEEQWIKAMIKYPILIERPIIIRGKKAVIGRPPERIFEVL